MIKRLLRHALISVGVLLVFPLSTSAQKPEPVREEFHQTFALSPNGRVSLENINGTVHIQAWERNEVKVDAVKVAYSREILNEAQIKVDSTSERLRIYTEYPDGNLSFGAGEYRRYQNPASVDYTLFIPRNARLTSIELVNGSLDIDGVAGDVNASCVNGKLTAHLLKGDVKLGTVNGGLEAIFDALDESKMISLGSVNGNVTVIIPSDSNAVIKAGTIHGSISNDFGLPVREGDYIGRDLYGQIGRGGARVKLGNVNGAVSIRRASDGRAVSPATSLLSVDDRDGKRKSKGDKSKSKSKDDADDDWDADWDQGDIDTERDARRAARDAQREAGRTQREAERAQAEARQAQLEAERAVAEAEREARQAAAESASEAQRAVDEAEREARQAAAETAREAQREAIEVARESQSQSAKAVRDAQREVVRVAREVARVARTEASNAVDVVSDANYRLVERDSSRFDVSETPRVTIETFDGAVSIHGWDKSEVLVNIVKRAGNEQAMRGIRFNAVKDGNQIKIVAGFDKNFAQRVAQGVTTTNANANLEVFVPRKSALHASSGDGHLAIDGTSGEVELITADGFIDVIDGHGRVLAKTEDGRIRIAKFDGKAEATTGDGRISLEGRFAQLTARTEHGSITLALPANFDATIETDAESIINESDATLTEDPTSSKRLRRWKIGKGGAVLRLHTGDGRIILRRASDQ